MNRDETILKNTAGGYRNKEEEEHLRHALKGLRNGHKGDGCRL